ncbi:kinesin-like protein KIF27 [Alosa sapidissima]|uniref:kinesin-like protein KIF27 n=1 Tax=Alosa sapidissima TaxID=34773 RepID=UPI001C084A22|nr:kinesin-like protein KIF27 [Alosa sapidissima]
MMEKVMRVAVRIRPLLPEELRQNREVCAHVAVDSRQVILAGGHAFPCHFAFGPTVSQEHVYGSSVKPLVASFFAGKDVTILAYGQSGSGKTYTLIGGHTDCEEDRGVVWRVCEDMFLKMTANDLTHLNLSACCVSLCGEELQDLLSPDAKQLNPHIMEDQNGNTVVEGAVEIPLGSVEDLHNVLDRMSESSSHTLLWLRLRQHSDSTSQSVLLSTLLMVDLAGWECVSGLVTADTPRFKRSLQISTELRTLADMIQQDKLSHAAVGRTQTTQASRAHTPCSPLTQLDGSDSPSGRRRDAHPSIRPSVHSISARTHTHSPLMRLLQNSLSVSAQTLLLVCVSPAQSSLTDTVSCLMLAAHAQDKYSRPDQRGVHTWAHTPSVPHTHSPLTRDAAVLLEELRDSAPSPALQQRLSAWLDAYKNTPSPSQGSEVTLCETCDVHQLPADTAACDETDAAPSQDAHTYVQSLQELKLHCRLQSELLVEQKLLADWLKRDLRAADSGGQRCKSSPLTDQRPAPQNRQPARCGTAGSRKVYSSPCNLSLERLSATMKTSNQLLLAQLEEQEQVLRLPSVTRGRETEAKDQSERKDKKRPLLNRTWTRKHAPDLSVAISETLGIPGLSSACDAEVSTCEAQSVLVSELLLEKERLQQRRDELSSRLSEENTHSEQDDLTLHQLEETIEAVDAVIGLREHPDQQRAPERQLSASSVPVDSLDRVLEELSLQEAKALFYTYFSKVVCLRERGASQRRCVRELEALLAAEQQQSARRLQQLEKEVFFYRSSSRELRRRLKELVQDGPSPASSRASWRRGSGEGGQGLGEAPD